MSLKTLRVVSFVEGLSLLILFLVAMPLKYYFDMPIFVRIVGSLHGFLFLLLVGVLAHAHFKFSLGWGKSLTIFGLAILPFGFIEAERLMKKENAV